MTDVAIRVERVSKRFKLYHNVITGPIKERLFFWKAHQYYQEFMAVRDVSFEIKRGEVVGIIGPNGAGKTTLLKMVAGLLPVQAGHIEVNGKITALLALVVGVHPEFAGRENILYGGMLLGMSKREVLRKMNAIIEFAELGKFIDQPFRTYSSGMRARLLFAISMSIDPDVLIVDEALATGDTHFLRKCTNRIREICASGATILFVSHNLLQIRQLCNRAYFMAEGSILFEGPPDDAIASYDCWAFEYQKTAQVLNEQAKFHMARGSGEVIITDIKLKNSRSEETTGFYSGDRMIIELCYHNPNSIRTPVSLAVGFMRLDDGTYVTEVDTDSVGRRDGIFERRPIILREVGVIRVVLDPLLLQYAHYSLYVALYDPNAGQEYCEYRNVSAFFVAGRQQAISLGTSLFWHPCKVTVE